MFRQFLFFAIFIGCILAIPQNAGAYLDPGTGSFIIQILIASFATAIFSIKIFWQKIKDKKIFSFLFRTDQNDEKEK